jgi:rRNA maturation protein Nop10
MLGEVSKDTGVHVSTLEDMFEKMKMTLSHSCPKCGSVWVSTPEELLAKFPKETPLKEVRMDCKCGCAKITSSPVSL